MLKSAFEELGLNLRIFGDTSTDTIFVPYASLYLDKSLYDLYEAMILKRDTDIHFMCVSRDEDYRPIVKKGILHQYGSDKKFTFEEQIELSCKKELFYANIVCGEFFFIGF